MNRPIIALAAASLAVLAAPLVAMPEDHAGHDMAATADPAADATQSAAQAASDAAADAALSAAGQTVYGQRCLGCHGAIGSEAPAMAPKLAGIVGKAAASGDGRYSPALKEAGIIWTPEKLGEFLAAPAKTVPGTRMAVGLADAELRAQVIAYLASTGPASPETE